jgi:hypothetical protein
MTVLKLLSAIFLMTSLQAFGQFDYELFQQYADSSMRQQNIKIKRITELQSEDKNKWIKTSYQELNLQGLPKELVQYDQQENKAAMKQFLYDSNNHILKTETYKGNNHEETTEFEVNAAGQITSYTDYVYSSADGEKLLVWKTYIDYNFNNTINKKIQLEGDNKDTVEVDYYDTLGVQTKTIQNRSGLRTTKIEYVWNKEKTEMKELHYENDSSVYTTITHKYKNQKEIERLDPSTSPKPIYWKYDSNGKVIETNENLYYVLYLTYDKDERLTDKVMNVLFSDADEKDLPKKIYFKYEYELR